MVKTSLKKINSLSLLLTLAIFPFGQLPSLLLSFLSGSFRSIQPIDLFVFVFVVTYLLINPMTIKNIINSKIFYLFTALIFSFLVGIGLGYFSNTSMFYLIRIISYLLFALTASTSVNVLLSVGAISAIFGLLQYIFLPDMRFMKAFGWDDHYFRLVGTFFDPAFIGIILVSTILLGGSKMRNELKKYLFLGFLLLCTLLTYSRASFLSLIVGVLVIFLTKQKNLWKFAFFIVLFISALLLLPRPSSEGVKLERTFSIFLRVKNYRETLEVWRTSPVFGVGYNNICEVRNNLLNNNFTALVSHSCSGADNSILLILSTTGVVGLIIFINNLYRLGRRIPKKELSLWLSLLAAIIIHSCFSNTLFYPWVIVWISLYISTIKLTQ